MCGAGSVPGRDFGENLTSPVGAYEARRLLAGMEGSQWLKVDIEPAWWLHAGVKTSRWRKELSGLRLRSMSPAPCGYITLKLAD